MFTTHLVAYTAAVGETTEIGIARVGTDRDAPTWGECAEEIPGFISGLDLGREPTYRLRYETPTGPIEKQVGSGAIVRNGRLLMRVADRGEIWNIEVFDDAGREVTFDFAVFCD